MKVLYFFSIRINGMADGSPPVQRDGKAEKRKINVADVASVEAWVYSWLKSVGLERLWPDVAVAKIRSEKKDDSANKRIICELIPEADRLRRFVVSYGLDHTGGAYEIEGIAPMHPLRRAPDVDRVGMAEDVPIKRLKVDERVVTIDTTELSSDGVSETMTAALESVRNVDSLVVRTVCGSAKGFRTTVDRIAAKNFAVAAIGLVRTCTRKTTRGAPTRGTTDDVLRSAYPAEGDSTSWFALATTTAAFDHERWDVLSVATRFVADAASRIFRVDDPDVALGAFGGSLDDAYRETGGGAVLFASLGDGRLLDPGSRVGRIVAATAAASRLRNGVGGGNGRREVVFSVPSRVAVERALCGCTQGCRQPCAHVRLSVFGGRTWATARDLARCRWISAGMLFDRVAGRIATDAGIGQEVGIPDLVSRSPGSAPVDGNTRKNAIARVVAAMEGRGPADAREKERIAVGVVRDAIEATRKAPGWSMLRDVVGFGCDETAAFSAALGRANIPDVQVNAEWGGGRRSGSSRNRERGRGTLPGYDETSRDGWNAAVVAKWAPPCIAKIVSECVASRHPKYHERMLVGTLLASIAGFADDWDGLRFTWKSLFMHPETPSVPKGDSPMFEESSYGTRALEDAARCVGRVKFGCKFASENGLCPFRITPCASAVSVSASGQPPGPETMESHRMVCRDRLEKEIGRVVEYVTPHSYYARKYRFDVDGNRGGRVVPDSDPAIDRNRE